MTGWNYFIRNIQRLEDMMFRSKERYLRILHVQMWHYFLYLLGCLILTVQPDERAKDWSLGLTWGVLISSLFIWDPPDVNWHSLHFVLVAHHVQQISSPCALYLLLYFLTILYTTLEVWLQFTYISNRRDVIITLLWKCFQLFFYPEKFTVMNTQSC